MKKSLITIALVLVSGVAFATGLTALQIAQQRLTALQGQKQMIDANYSLQSDQIGKQIASVTNQIATLTNSTTNSSN